MALSLRHLLAGACAVALLSSTVRDVRAQARPSIDARTWRPSTDPNASLVVEPAITPGPGVLTLGAYAHYSNRPVTLRFQGTDEVALRPVRNVLGVDAFANLGIGQRLSIGLAVPVIVYQNGSQPLPATVSQLDQVPTTAFGDIGVTMKGALVRNENGGFGLAALGYGTLPTGDRASFAGDGSATVAARLLAEYTLLVAVAQASVGYKLRTDHHTWPAPEVGGIRFGDEIPWTAGLAFRPGLLGVDPGNRQRWEVAFHGWLPAGPVGPFGSGAPGSAALSPVLLALSDRIELGHYRDTFLTLGGEIGLNQAVGVPVFRAIVGIGWAPREHDIDHDGVRDDIDGCPDIPEDRDGFEDSDGCPEIDNDDDGVIDREDACPNVAGAFSDDPKKNGCAAGVAVDAVQQIRDADRDGIEDARDKCPEEPEDQDGFEDEDGCPDPDNDGDGIGDGEDACPSSAGEASTDPVRHGCPSLDRDGDTFDNEHDKCPDAAEVFNGNDDEDGCPDEGGKPLVTVDEKRNVRLAQPLAFVGPPEAPDVDPKSIPTLRALALELNRHRDWTFAVGARPAGGDANKAQLDSLAKAFAVVRALSLLTTRDGAAETVGWDAVKSRPQAASGVAFLVLVMPPNGPTAPESPKPLAPAVPPKLPPTKP